MMNISKKMIMSAVMSVALLIGSAAFASRCQTCEEKMVIQQSIKDALQSIGISPDVEEFLAEQADIVQKCGCNKPKPKPSVVVLPKPSRAERDDSSSQVACNSGCSSCCSAIKKMNNSMKHLAHNLKKCCSRTKNQLSDIEDLVLSQTDEAATCCSVIETRIGDLGGSITDFPLQASINDQVNSADLDMIVWLKSIYSIVAQIYYCTCT